ncbi:MAG: YceI family protein [Bacteroidota bacterium]
MKSRLSLIGLLAALVFAGFAFTEPTTDAVALNVDTNASQVIWKGYKVTGSHEGTVQLKNGSLDYDNGQLTGGSFEIDMTTINCTDLQGDYKGQLEGHLKSADFFGVENYPTAKFVITKVISRGKPGDYKITGNLTIKETTKEVKFQTTVNESGAAKTAKGKLTIDRSEFDVRYGSGSFFDNLGDKTIYDEFDLEFTLVTK